MSGACLIRALLAGVTLGNLEPHLQAQILGDDFGMDSNAAWLDDYLIGHGQLNRARHHLEYSVPVPDLASGDEAYRPWGGSTPALSTDWEVSVDVSNIAVPAGDQVASFGLEVLDANNYDNYAFVEIYSSRLHVPALRRGFKADLAVAGVELGKDTILGDHMDIGVTSGSVRLTFNSSTKVLTAWFDPGGGTNGYLWERLGTFGIAGAGGSTTNADWRMQGNDAFIVTLYGYSRGMAISAGQMYGDNFLIQPASVEPPWLSISLAPAGLQLRWPAAAIGYELESATALAPDAWVSIPGVPSTIAGTNLLSRALDNQARFFRLRK